MSWLILAVGLVTVLWLLWRVRNRKLLQLANQLPGPRPLPVLGNAWELMRNPEGFLMVLKNMMMEYGDVMRFWLGPDLNVLVSDPDAIKVLLTSSKTSAKGIQYKYMADVIGEGILSGSGPIWRRHRKIATPNFGKRAIEGYCDIFNREVHSLLEEFRAMAGTQTDLYHTVVRTTTFAACQTLMGLSKEETNNLPHLQDVINDTHEMYEVVFGRMTKWWLQIDPVFWLTRQNKIQNKFIKMMNGLSEAIVENRIKTLQSIGEETKKDLVKSEQDFMSNTQLSVIDRFILSNELSKQELLQETFTVFTSSQEAMAKISSFMLLMLAYHPECQAKAYAEVVSVMGDKDRAVTNEDLKKMPYLEMVFKEVIRLFPIGAVLQRCITEDCDLKSVTLPSGCSLIIPIFHMHRDARYWDNPDAFDPERFNPENSRLRHPYCYIPFSLGPMDCLGRHFGTKLVKTLCARVIREFHLTSRDSYSSLRIYVAVSVVSVNGCHAIITPRKPLC